MTEKTTIPARQVKPGQTIVEYAHPTRTAFRKRAKTVRVIEGDRRGRLPVVTSAEYEERGEGGKPTVYITTTQTKTGVLCFNPDDQVTVEEG